ncbi:MAG TPA: HAMP domain-containing protein, partial [Candidatus Binatia bacterium]|nr:HAMP domain-containing protein [Candidatus Binatia bacterium]
MIRNFFSSLRGRLLLLVFLAVVFGLLLYTAWEQRLAAIQNAKQDALKLARDAVQRQEILVSEARRYLGELAQRPELHSIKSGACSALMASGLKNKNGYTFIGATDLDGNVLCSALPHERPLNVADRSFFQKTTKTRDFSIGNYQIDPVSGKATIDFGYPNFDSRGHFQGTLFATLDLSWLDKFLAETNKSSGIILTVIDHNGVILGRATEPETWVGKTMPQHPMIRAILSRKGEGTVEGTGMDSVHRLYAFAPLRISGDAPVYISVGISTEVPYANVLLPGVITALVLLIAWVGSDLFLLRQVKALISATRRIASGELGARTGLPVSSGELNQLAQSFDAMSEALQMREAELRRSKEQVQHNLQRIRALHDIDMAISSTLDLATVL